MSRNKDKNRIDRKPDDLDGCCPAAPSSPRAGRKRRCGLVWLTLVLVLAAGTGVVRWKEPALWSAAEHTIRRAVAITAPAVSEADAAVRQNPLPMPDQPLAIQDRDPQSINTPPISTVKKCPPTLEELYIVQIGDQLRVAAAFSRMPGYRLFRQDRGKRLVLELPEGTAVSSLPDGATPPMLKKLTREVLCGRVQLVFSLDRVCRCDEQELRDNSDGEGRALLFVVRPEPVAGVPTAAPVPPPPAETPEPAPVVPADAGQPSVSVSAPAAKTFVRQAVRITDRQHAAASYRDLTHRIHLVRLLIEKGKLSLARAELTRKPLPPVGEVPDLHAMSATVNLRQGRYREAAETYRNLLEVQPGKAVWWMGLGIALEGDADQEEARHAYGRALRHEGLSDNLENFIRRRLAASASGQAGQPLAGRNPDEERS